MYRQRRSWLPDRDNGLLSSPLGFHQSNDVFFLSGFGFGFLWVFFLGDATNGALKSVANPEVSNKADPRAISRVGYTRILYILHRRDSEAAHLAPQEERGVPTTECAP